jgi:hypothetical protein
MLDERRDHHERQRRSTQKIETLPENGMDLAEFVKKTRELGLEWEGETDYLFRNPEAFPPGQFKFFLPSHATFSAEKFIPNFRRRASWFNELRQQEGKAT